MENVNEVPMLQDILPILEVEAKRLGLNVYVYDNDEVSRYHNTANKILGVALLSRNSDNALVNLKRLNKCYLVRLQ